MRCRLAGLLVLSMFFVSFAAVAKDTPPPPPPPPAEHASGGDGDSAFRQRDGLLDVSGKTRKQMLSFFAGIPWGGYLGYGYGYGGFPLDLGARYYIPIVHNGFIPQINDSFGIEFGADLNVLFAGS